MIHFATRTSGLSADGGSVLWQRRAMNGQYWNFWLFTSSKLTQHCCTYYQQQQQLYVVVVNKWSCGDAPWWSIIWCSAVKTLRQSVREVWANREHIICILVALLFAIEKPDFGWCYGRAVVILLINGWCSIGGIEFETFTFDTSLA